MKKSIAILLFSTALFFASCSEGTQTGQQMLKLIDEKNITTIVVMNDNNKPSHTLEIDRSKLIIENQFLKIDEEYINLTNVKMLKVNEKQLVVSM